MIQFITITIPNWLAVLLVIFGLIGGAAFGLCLYFLYGMTKMFDRK